MEKVLCSLPTGDRVCAFFSQSAVNAAVATVALKSAGFKIHLKLYLFYINVDREWPPISCRTVYAA